MNVRNLCPLEMHLTGTAPEPTKLIAKTGRPGQP